MSLWALRSCPATSLCKSLANEQDDFPSPSNNLQRSCTSSLIYYDSLLSSPRLRFAFQTSHIATLSCFAWQLIGASHLAAYRLLFCAALDLHSDLRACVKQIFVAELESTDPYREDFAKELLTPPKCCSRLYLCVQGSVRS